MIDSELRIGDRGCDRRRRSSHARSTSSTAGTRTSARSRRGARQAARSATSRSRRRRADALGAGDLDVCFFSIGTQWSRELVPVAAAAGAVCVDKSSAFRLEPGIPLVVPEVNGERALEHTGIVANPNCCTIPLTMVLAPLHDAAGLRSVRVATYQSVSGAGSDAIDDLRAEEPDDHQLRMDWEFDGVEYDEEVKLREETRKILELPELPVSATCVRVPVVVGHAEAVWIETETPLAPAEAERILARGARPSRREGSGARARDRHRRGASSGGSAPIRRRRTASCSSSSATTSARARRSTRSRSPSSLVGASLPSYFGQRAS